MKIWNFTLVAFSVLLLFSPPVLADYYWIGGSGAWEDGSNWNMVGTDGKVYISNNGTTSINVTINALPLTGSAPPYYNSGPLYIGYTGTGEIIFTQGNINPNNHLRFTDSRISGKTTYIQLNGVNYVWGGFGLGQDANIF